MPLRFGGVAGLSLFMKITIDSRPPKQTGSVEVRFISCEAKKKALPDVAAAEFSGKMFSSFFLRSEAVLYVGMGEAARIDGARLRDATGAAVMTLMKIGRTKVVLRMEEYARFAGQAVEGALLASYRFERFKVSQTTSIERLHLAVDSGDLAEAKQAVARAEILGKAINAAREIGNLPGNLIYPASLAEAAVAMAKEKGLRSEVWDEKRLEADAFGGLLAVGGGSVRGPRMVLLEHRGGKKGEAPLVFVGKSITFDSGGISIKPASSMEEMIFDKCGGIAVIGAMSAIAELKVKRNVIGLLASAENMPGGQAYRPGDIVTIYGGKHVEIVNTDAEGRVVLADVIAYAHKVLKPSAIIDLATLTGACGVALGDQAAGLWANSPEFSQRVAEAAGRAGERVWPMPLFSEHEQQIQSSVAEIKNSAGRLGGACTAAAFLKVFAEETPWAHFDIAYTAHRDKNLSHLASGATGYGIRTLVELARSL